VQKQEVELAQRQKKTAAFALFFLLLFVLGTGTLLFRHAGLWLAFSERLPDPLNVIFTFGGENDRVNYSKQLLKNHPEALWIVSYPRKNIIVPFSREGLDTSRIFVVDTCKNTFSEVDCVVKLANDIVRNNAAFLNGKSRPNGGFSNRNRLNVALVSSPYHMRRIKILVSRIKKNSSCAFFCCAVPFEQSTLSKQAYTVWWKNSRVASVVLLEIKKIFYYLWK
jgi:uncharacterized SAM-binding protein YcdF (DUF218 family)